MNNIKVLYDHQAFTFQYFGGVSKCFCELISHLPKDVIAQISIEESNNIHLKKIYPDLKQVSYDINSFSSKHKFKGNRQLYSLINKICPFLHTTENKNRKKSIELLKQGNYNVFHPTFFDDYFLPLLGKKTFVLTIHDMMPELFPEYFGKYNKQVLIKRKLIKKAAAIIAVSEQTKKDIVNILNVPNEKIIVIYHGAPPKEVIKEPKLVEEPYFLYVGIRNAYKNFKQTLLDFYKVTEKNMGIKLVCTGNEFTNDESKLITQLKLQQNIIHIQANDNQLKNLYANAIAFIYPSLYEGFGMPILEAFSYGCPVLLNNKSCFPEIAHDAAIYFNSDKSASNLPDTMLNVINWSSNEREYYIQKGYQRMSYFSWEKSANLLANLYKDII